MCDRTERQNKKNKAGRSEVRRSTRRAAKEQNSRKKKEVPVQNDRMKNQNECGTVGNESEEHGNVEEISGDIERKC